MAVGGKNMKNEDVWKKGEKEKRGGEIILFFIKV